MPVSHHRQIDYYVIQDLSGYHARNTVVQCYGVAIPKPSHGSTTLPLARTQLGQKEQLAILLDSDLEDSSSCPSQFRCFDNKE